MKKKKKQGKIITCDYVEVLEDVNRDRKKLIEMIIKIQYGNLKKIQKISKSMDRLIEKYLVK